MKKLLISALKYGVVIFVFFIAAVALLPRFPVFGNFQSLVVLSGSMEPKIKTGSVVLVRAQPEYQVGDVVTFGNSGNYVTHRIVTISEGQKIITKGDVNPASDQKEISVQDIRGKVIFSIPYLGYAANFSKTRLGFALFIILPAILIIIGEIKSLLRGSSASAKAGSLCALILFFTAAFGSGISLAYFSDTETALGNVINAGVWEEEPEDSIADHVVISEALIDPSGSESKNEFVELYNPTNSVINLSGWDIAYKPAAPASWSTKATISSGSIQSHGFFLIGGSEVVPAPDLEDSSLGFADPGGHIAIRNASDVIIDKLGYGTASDPEGTAASSPGTNQSLERKSGLTHDDSKGNGQDTDNNAVDFYVRVTPAPQNTSNPTETPPGG